MIGVMPAPPSTPLLPRLSRAARVASELEAQIQAQEREPGEPRQQRCGRWRRHDANHNVGPPIEPGLWLLALARAARRPRRRLSQQAKAADASATELAHSAAIAAETYATDDNGTDANLSLAAIGQYDAAIPVTPTAGRAHVSAVANASTSGDTVTINPATGAEIFSLTRSNGAMTRARTPATGVNGRW